MLIKPIDISKFNGILDRFVLTWLTRVMDYSINTREDALMDWGDKGMNHTIEEWINSLQENCEYGK